MKGARELWLLPFLALLFWSCVSEISADINACRTPCSAWFSLRARTWPPPVWQRRCRVFVGILGSPRWRSFLLVEQGSVSVWKSPCQRPQPHAHTTPIHVGTHFNIMCGTQCWDADSGIIPTESWGVSRLWPGHYSLLPLHLHHSSFALSICSHSVTMKSRKLSRVERLWKVSVSNLFRNTCNQCLLLFNVCHARHFRVFLLIMLLINLLMSTWRTFSKVITSCFNAWGSVRAVNLFI